MSPAAKPENGFTLLEMLIVLGTISIILAMSMLVLPGMLEAARADSGSTRLSTTLRMAREQAISERRNIEIRFVIPDRIEVARIEVDGNGSPTGETVLQRVILGERMEFLRWNDHGDTPDGFGAGAGPITFTGSEPWRFTTEGQLVDANGDVVNGTVFVGVPQLPLTARAVTLFGPTALLREWAWNGSTWMD